MRIAVRGVGGYFGGKLAAAGEDVTFVVKGDPFEMLRIESVKGDFVIERPRVMSDPATAGKVDAVVIYVSRRGRCPEATESILPLLGDDTPIVPLKNGSEAPEQIANVAGRAHAVGGLLWDLRLHRGAGTHPPRRHRAFRHGREARLPSRACRWNGCATPSSVLGRQRRDPARHPPLDVVEVSFDRAEHGIGAISRVPIGV
jgi:2-dehydropantoate 2-reductase